MSHQGRDGVVTVLRQKISGIAELCAVRSPTSCQDRSVSFLIRSGLAMMAIGRTPMAIVLGMLKTMTPWGHSGSAKRSAEARRDRTKDADERTVVSLGSCTDIPALLQRPHCDACTTRALILRSYAI